MGRQWALTLEGKTHMINWAPKRYGWQVKSAFIATGTLEACEAAARLLGVDVLVRNGYRT